MTRFTGAVAKRNTVRYFLRTTLAAAVVFLSFSGIARAENFKVPLKAGWQLVSFPIEADVDVCAAVAGEAGSLLTYNGGGYAACSAENTPAPGKSYWVYRPAAETAELSGGRTRVCAPYKLQLEAGWNFVASPFQYSARAAAMRGTGKNPAPQPVPEFYEYDAATEAYGKTAVLEPWKGYLAYSKDKAELSLLPSGSGLPDPVPSCASSGIRITAEGDIPAIEKVIPFCGPAGTVSTISGFYFGAMQGASSVSFAYHGATGTVFIPAGIVSWSDTEIKALLPEYSGSAYYNDPFDVSVTTSYGTSSYSSGMSSYFYSSNIESISPTTVHSGDTIAIDGFGFGCDTGYDSFVSFDNSVCSFLANTGFCPFNSAQILSWSDTRITVKTPIGAESNYYLWVAPFSRIVSSGENFPLTVTNQPPEITSIDGIDSCPDTYGQDSCWIDISGQNFFFNLGSDYFNYLFIRIDDELIALDYSYYPYNNYSGNDPLSFDLPDGIPSGNLTLESIYGVSNSVPFTSPYTKPGINYIWHNSPDTGEPLILPALLEGSSVASIYFAQFEEFTAGETVTIHGARFGDAQGDSTLTVAGIPVTEITTWTDRHIIFRIPIYAVSGDVVINTSLGSSYPYHLNILNDSTIISSISPSSGVAGTNVTINGVNFGATQGTSTARFNGISASCSTWSDTQLVCAAPAGVTTGSIVVTTGGVPSNGVVFTVVSAPVISSISPGLGVIGTSVTINGSGFGTSQGASVVKFNTTTATEITSWSDVKIVVKVPAGATSGSTKVTTPGGTSNGIYFTVTIPPAITTISPASGNVGTSVTINGTNFGAARGTSVVKFNGAEAVSYTSWTATRVIVKAPAGATTGPVTVTTPAAGESNGVNFTVTYIPVITTVSPASGIVGTTDVTITGINFGASQGTSVVKFNGVAATTITSWSDTSITARVPATATTGPVTVTTTEGTSNAKTFTVWLLPSITSLTPASGNIGASVTISGANFGASRGTGVVKFNGTSVATYVSWVSTKIVVKVPAGATSGPVTVTTIGGASAGVNFTVTYVPTITSISPVYGGVGRSVTITGTNYGASQGTSAVKFNGVEAAIISWTSTKIVATVPATATTGPVTVTTTEGTSNAKTFTVWLLPSITSLTPASGNIGASITIIGANFGASRGTGVVRFNGTSVATYVSWVSTKIVVKVPAGATSGPVTVTTIGGTSAGVNFTVTYVPTITSISPVYGGVGRSVTITGTNYGATQGTSAVKFNGVEAAIISWTSTKIVATVPATATTGPVTVTTTEGTSNAKTFTVWLLPSITSLTPASGNIGANITITGADFGATRGVSVVKFNGINVSTYVSWSDTAIVARVPTAATSGNVTVTTYGGTSAGMNFTVN